MTNTHSEMVERVAKAIYERMSSEIEIEGRRPDDWSDSGPESEMARDQWRRIARAAIAAMRPDTFGDLPEPIVLAGAEAIHMAGGSRSYSMAHGCFQAMIDAALPKKGEGDA